MQQTKYYTISEVADLLNISQPSLRYFEKIIARLKIRKIRGRRYYSQENIEILRNKIGNITTVNSGQKQYSFFAEEKPQISKEKQTKIVNSKNIIEKISVLEQKFLSLRNRLL